MAYCGPKGIPLSQFLSWSEGDRKAALEWQAWESRRCRQCGTHPEDWDPKWGGSETAFHPEHHQCPGCAQTEQYSESLGNVGKGIRISLAPGGIADCPPCRAMWQ